MTTCASCGHREVEERDFCSSCGAYLRWDERTGEHSAMPEPEPVTEPLAAAPATAVAAATLALSRPGQEARAGATVGLAVEPGAETTLLAHVRNQSGLVDNYELRVTGWPDAWWTVHPRVVHLVPFGADDGSAEQEVLIRLHPPRAPEATARPWPVEITATSGVQNGVVASAPASVEIRPYHRFEIRIRPERAAGDGDAEFALPIRNLGNAPLGLELHGADADGEVRFAFSPPHIDVPAGADACAGVRVSARRPRNTPLERRLTIEAVGEGERRVLTATFAQRPLLTPARVRTWRWLVTLLAALLLAGGAFMDWTADGLNAICAAGADGCLRYDVFAQRFLDVDPGVPQTGTLDGLFSFATSIGIPVLALAVVVLLGIRTGAAAWFGGVVSVLLIAGYLIVAGDAGLGLWAALAGGVLAIVGGLLAASR
jgi:hypothetical protein